MSLDEMLDDLLDPHAVRADDDGDRLVALRLADDWGVGVRLHRRGTHRQWNVREVTLRLMDSESSISGNDVRELPLGALLAEAKRLATRTRSPRRRPRPAWDWRSCSSRTAAGSAAVTTPSPRSRSSTSGWWSQAYVRRPRRSPNRSAVRQAPGPTGSRSPASVASSRRWTAVRPGER